MRRRIVAIVALLVLLAGCGHVLSLLFLGDFALTYLSDPPSRAVSRSLVGESATAYPENLVRPELGRIAHAITPSEFTLFVPRVKYMSLQDTEAWVVVVATFPDRLADEFYLADFMNGPTRIYPPRGRTGTMDTLWIEFNDTFNAEYPRLDDTITFELPAEYTDSNGLLLDLPSVGGSYQISGNTITATNQQALYEPLLPAGSNSASNLVMAHGFETGLSGGGDENSPYSPMVNYKELGTDFLVAPLAEVFEVPLSASAFDVKVFFDVQDAIVIWDNGTPDYLNDDVLTFAPLYWERFSVQAQVIE